jgi:GNAT superfamily N-acetyltransferase
MPNPSFNLRFATPSDVPQMCDVYFDAWRDSVIAQTFFPQSSKQVQKFWLDGLTDELQEKHAKMLLIMDTSTSPETMVAFAKWNTPLEIDEEHLPMPPPEVWPQDGDPDNAIKFFTVLFDKHETIMGNRPHWYLEMISTRKIYQGKGAASMLIRWGVEKADLDGVECYLDSTPDGKSTYQRYGFKEVESERFFDGKYEQCFMVRDAKK